MEAKARPVKKKKGGNKGRKKSKTVHDADDSPPKEEGPPPYQESTVRNNLTDDKAEVKDPEQAKTSDKSEVPVPDQEGVSEEHSDVGLNQDMEVNGRVSETEVNDRASETEMNGRVSETEMNDRASEQRTDVELNQEMEVVTDTINGDSRMETPETTDQQAGTSLNSTSDVTTRNTVEHFEERSITQDNVSAGHVVHDEELTAVSDKTSILSFNYEPPKSEDLPNLESLLDTLDGGQSNLEAETDPPHLFLLPEQEPNYREISNLETTLKDELIDPYVDKFDDSIRDEVLMIGNISLEEVQEEERRLRDEHIAYQQQETLMARQRQEAILLKEEKAKEHVVKVMKEKRRDLARREELNLQRERLLQNQLHHSFKKSESQLKRVLSLRKGEIKTMYGDLMMADGEYGGSKGRRWKVDWNKAPQPVQIKLNCIRGVKDKLPSGRFVLMVSLYDRLGGHVLRWSSLRGQEWGGATLPLNHDGNFFNVEITIEQSVFTVLPAKPKIRPGMVLLFELFLLRGTLLPVDKVVSWGVFPICDGQFEVLQGRYKAPMLRGEFDPRIEKHEVIEKLMASDLDHWMSNIYFEIVKLPRYIAGQKEYEVELQFSSQLMSFPDRVKGAEEAVDGEQPVPGSSLSVDSAGSGNNAPKEKISSAEDGSSESIPKKGSDLSNSQETLTNEKKVDNKEIPDSDGVRFRGSNQQPTVIGSRKLMKTSEKASLDDSESDSDNDDMIMKRDDGFCAVKGESGLYYKQHTNPVATEYMRRLYTMLPKTALLNQKKKRKNLTHLERLDTHSFAVQAPFSTKGHLERKGHEKIQYVSRQILSEMGLSQWRSREFWTLILLLCLIFFIRMYLHYIGQWAFLNIINIPVSSFDFYPYTVSLNYQSSLLHTREEVAVVLLGPATNIIVLSLLVITCWLTQKTIGNFPDLFCKLIMVYAILTFLDPILIAIVDAPLGRYDFEIGDEPIADSAKLYFHFYRIHNNGLMGILLTVPIYLSMMFLSFVIFYMYFLRLHNNGRMLDIYHRLHATEDEFFLPYDLEISNQELAFICKKAEQYRGEEGERRKVAVYDYIWAEEEEDGYEDNEQETKPSREEVTTHVSIHTLHLDGLKEMHRHFLKLPDGAIVEVFGEMGVSGIDKDLKTALQNESHGNHKPSESTDRITVRPKTVGGFSSQDLLNVPGSVVPSVTNSQASFEHQV